jgi:hypothetical protein
MMNVGHTFGTSTIATLAEAIALCAWIALRNKLAA